MKDDLLTTLCTHDEKVFIDFYCFMAKFCILKNFERHFRVSKKLGEGSFSVVYEGKSIFSNSEVALKVFDKKKLLQTSDGIEILKNQIINLEKLKNFGLSPLIETYETQDCIILVLKKAECGHMINYIQQHQSEYDEKITQMIMKKVFENLKALHSAGFIHRDIKPENILFDSHKTSFQLFLADFGLTVEKNTPRNVIGKKCSGTLGFVAPQILHSNQYDEKCDVFSAGCLLYFLLTRKSIFPNMGIEQIMMVTVDNDYINRKLKRIPVEFQSAKNLLKALLNIDPKLRISAEEALSREFLNQKNDEEDRFLNKLYGENADETIKYYITKKVKNFWK